MENKLCIDNGYIVFLRLTITGKYAEYTSLKRPVELPMAESLAEHLRRNKTDAMIVAAATGEIVKEVRA